MIKYLTRFFSSIFSYLKFSLLDHEVTLLISSLEEKLLLQNVSIEFCLQVNFYAWYFHSVPMSSLIPSRSLKSLDKLFFFLLILFTQHDGEKMEIWRNYLPESHKLVFIEVHLSSMFILFAFKLHTHCCLWSLPQTAKGLWFVSLLFHSHSDCEQPHYSSAEHKPILGVLLLKYKMNQFLRTSLKQEEEQKFHS